jgi:hypothetical protein
VKMFDLDDEQCRRLIVQARDSRVCYS